MQQPSRSGRDLTTGSIPAHLLELALPMLLGNLLNSGYSIIDAIWIGRIAGDIAVGAIAVSFPIIFVFVALAGGATMATTILVSQYYGAKRLDDVHKTVGCSFALAFALGTVLALAGVGASPWVLRLLRTPPELYPMAVPYLRLTFIGFVPMYFSFLITSILRGVGDTRTPLYFMGIGVVLNAILDPLLIAGYGPFPRLGLNGAAIASVFSSVVAALIGMWWLNRSGSIVAFRPANIRLDRSILALIARIGLPSAAQQATIALGMATVTSVINTFGATATSAFGITGRIDSLAYMPAMSIGMAVSAVAGQNLGAGKPDRVQSVFRWGMLMTLAITGAFSICFVSFPALLMRAFVTDPAVIDIGVVYLRIVGPASMLFAAMFVSNGVINGAGQTTITLIFSLFSMWILRVPLATFLARTPLGLTGVWIAFSGSFAVTLTASLIYYRSGRWKKSVISRGPLIPPLIGAVPPPEPEV